MNDAPVSIIVSDLGHPLAGALNTEAQARGVSVTELAAQILSAHYQVPREPTTGNFIGITSPDRVILRVPWQVRQALNVTAAGNGWTQSGLVKKLLSEALGLEPPDPRRKERAA